MVDSQVSVPLYYTQACCIMWCMNRRTSIVLDQELVEKSRRYAGDSSTRELVDVALREYVENHRRRDLRELRGRVNIQPGYDHKRLRYCTLRVVDRDRG